MDAFKLGVAPVSDQAPAGVDPTYEPEFEALQAEIDKLGMVAAGQAGIDWAKVAELADGILAAKAKHLLVAAYLGAALVKTDGLTGLADGAKVLLDLCRTFWDTMFPPPGRARARANAVTWWRDQALGWFEALNDIDPVEPALVESLGATLGDLDALLGDKLGDQAPTLRELTGYLARLPVAAPAPAEPEPAAAKPDQGPLIQSAQAEATTAPVQAAAPPPAASGDPAADAKALVGSALDQLQRASTLLLSKDLSDPAAFRLKRLSAWTQVVMAPPAEDGRTMIPPPEDDLKTALAGLKAGRQYEELVRACEERTPQTLFWLDLHRQCAEALDMLGPRYKDALDAVCLETALLVRRLPEIVSLGFADGTPFADPQTKTWLASIALDRAGEGGPPAGEASERAAQALSQAMDLAKDKKVVAAVTLLQEALRSAASGKDRFGLLVGMAGLLAQAGRTDLARPNVAEAVRLIDDYKLDQWEPDTALRGLTACYAAVRGDPAEEAKAMATNLLMRVARLSPAAAMRLQV